MSKDGYLTQALNKTVLSRRSFLKWSAVIGGTAALAGGIGVGLKTIEKAAAEQAQKGQWIPACCWPDCGGKGFNKVYVVDGVVVRGGTDDTIPDSPLNPQLKGCAKGRSQRKHLLGVDRLKYPMKRKNWEPGGGKKELRGKDEWVRISWDEALDIIASELKRIKETYGNEAILANHVRMPLSRMLSLYGGFVDDWGSQSGGCWPAVDKFGFPNAWNDRMDLYNTQLFIMWGLNPAWSRAGNPTYNFLQYKQGGAKFIFIDPFYNPSAQVLADEWVPIRPATDQALVLGMAHTLLVEDDPITNPLIDWDFLNRCTVGFDKDHMPEGADPKMNFKDYVLGTFDGQPKSAEWAAEICGIPPEKIRMLAREIAQTEKTAICMSPAPTRVHNADSLPQAIMTFGAMTGHLGKSGSMVAADGGHQSIYGGGGKLIQGGSGYARKTYMRAEKITNPLAGNREAGISYYTQVAGDGVVCLNMNEVWTAVLEGKFTAGKNDIRPIDIHMIWHAHGAKMNQLPGTLKSIEAHRKVDFVVTQNFFLTTDAKYSDIVLPVTSNWEKWGDLTPGYREQLLWTSQVIPPYFESKDDIWIAREVGARIGLDPKVIEPWSWKQEIFNEVADTKVIMEDGKTWENLVTITQEDIDEFGVEGEPQVGRIPIKEFKEKGIYHVTRKPGDNLGYIALKEFREDPEANKLDTPSGKLEIYSQAYADYVNNCGWIEIEPIPMYHRVTEGFEDTFKDWDKKIKGDYPLQQYSVHILRRAHSTFENVPWLREAFQHELFMNKIDADARGIKQGDWALIESRHGKVLRPVWVTELIMPGVVALPQGAWVELDEESGIDLAGCTNVLNGPITDGQGQCGWNSCNVQVTKWTGATPEPDYKWPPRVPIKEGAA